MGVQYENSIAFFPSQKKDRFGARLLRPNKEVL